MLPTALLTLVLALSPAARPRPEFPAGPCAILVNGDRIPGTPAGGDERGMRWKTADSTIPLPLASLDVLWLGEPPAETPAFPDRYTWLANGRKTDVVLLRNGDVLTGDLEGFTAAGGVRLRAAGEATAKVHDVAAVAVNPALTVSRKPKGLFSRVVTANGARMTLANVTTDANALRGTTAFNAKVELPIGDVVARDDFGGTVVPLTDLTPAEVKQEPFGSLVWPWVAGRSVKSRPLQIVTALGTETCDFGLGTHPRTVLSYDLKGQYRTFEAIVGLAADSGRRGSANVRVLVDDAPAAIPGLATLAAATGAVTLRVDVTKAKRLTLDVNFGPAGDVQADVNWGNARLVR